MNQIQAILLAGGQARRMSGVDKPLLQLAGTSLLEAGVAASMQVCESVLVVGPHCSTGTQQTWVTVLEPVRYLGPAYALEQAVAVCVTPWVLVLSADLVYPDEMVRLLAEYWNVLDERAEDERVDGVCLRDAAGNDQWLCAIYRTDRLRQEFAARPDTHNLSLRSLVQGLNLIRVSDSGNATVDIDTWNDFVRAWNQKEVTMNLSGTHSDVTPPNDPNQQEAWLRSVWKHLGYEPVDIPAAELLALTRDIAHGITRTSGPLTMFLMGYIAGNQNASPEQISVSIAAVKELIS